MKLSVPLGSALGIGRGRPYKIGAPADVETVQSMYPYHVSVLAYCLPPVLQCCGVVQRPPGWPTPCSRPTQEDEG
jgi:hypothetical protein